MISSLLRRTVDDLELVAVIVGESGDQPPVPIPLRLQGEVDALVHQDLVEAVDGVGDEHDAGPDPRLLLVVRLDLIEDQPGALVGRGYLHVALVLMVPRHLEPQDLDVQVDGLGQVADRDPHLADLQELSGLFFWDLVIHGLAEGHASKSAKGYYKGPERADFEERPGKIPSIDIYRTICFQLENDQIS